MKAIFVVLRAATYASIFIGLFLIFVPARLISWSGIARPDPIGGLEIIGAIIVVGGAALALSCVFTFAFVGRGTPAPFDPPRQLVVRGPYRFVRNPMYIGAGMALAGAAVFYRSLPLFVYTLAFVLITHLFVLLYEEPTLGRTFGIEYAAYRERVNRWLPRFLLLISILWLGAAVGAVESGRPGASVRATLGSARSRDAGGMAGPEVRSVDALGAVRAARHRRVVGPLLRGPAVPGPRRHAVHRVQGDVLRADSRVQSAAVRPGSVGRGGPGRRNALRGVHHQAPRRLQHVGHEADGLSDHRPGQSVPRITRGRTWPARSSTPSDLRIS